MQTAQLPSLSLRYGRAAHAATVARTEYTQAERDLAFALERQRQRVAAAALRRGTRRPGARR